MDHKKLNEDNFDLEQKILGCWGITSDLSELVNDFTAGKLTADQAIELIESYSIVYENRFNKTWELYESVCQGLRDLRLADKQSSLDSLLDKG